MARVTYKVLFRKMKIIFYKFYKLSDMLKTIWIIVELNNQLRKVKRFKKRMEEKS